MELNTTVYEAGSKNRNPMWKLDGQVAKTHALRFFPYEHVITEQDLKFPGRYFPDKGHRVGDKIVELFLPVPRYWINPDNKFPAVGPVPKFEEELKVYAEDTTPDGKDLYDKLSKKIARIKFMVNAVVVSESDKELRFTELPQSVYWKVMKLITKRDSTGEYEYPNLLGARGRDFLVEVNPGTMANWYQVTLRDREKSKQYEDQNWTPLDFHAMNRYMPGYNVPEKYREDWMVKDGRD